jgi:hypothetical protein
MSSLYNRIKEKILRKKEPVLPAGYAEESEQEIYAQKRAPGYTERFLEGGGVIGWTKRNIGGIPDEDKIEFKKRVDEFQRQGGLIGAILRVPGETGKGLVGYTAKSLVDEFRKSGLIIRVSDQQQVKTADAGGQNNKIYS